MRSLLKTTLVILGIGIALVAAACQTISPTSSTRTVSLEDFPKSTQDWWHVKGLTLLPDGTLAPKEGIEIQPAEAGTNPTCVKYLGEGAGHWLDEYFAPRTTVRVTVYRVTQAKDICHVWFAVSTGVDRAGIINVTPGFTLNSGEIRDGVLSAKFPKGPGTMQIDGDKMEFLVHSTEFENPYRARLKWSPKGGRLAEK